MSLKSFFADIFGDPYARLRLGGERAQEWLYEPGSDSRPYLIYPRQNPIFAAPTREEFATWRDNPITEFVMAALARNAEECREQWMQISWDGGDADQRRLDAFRERSDALLGFTADYDAFCETLGLEPQPLEVDDAA